MLGWGVGRGATKEVALPAPPEGDYIPVDFEENVLSHIVSNQMYPREAPVLLLIIGAPGTGKTHQVERLCAKYGMHCEPTNGAEFQGTEGQSKRNLVRAYTKAVKGVFEDKPPPCRPAPRQSILMIDDFHLSLASVLSENFSQNSQIFMAALMTGCTNPLSLFDGRDGDKFVRVPIIATANSAKELYKPLLRHGRVRIYHWEPSEKDRLQIGLYYLAMLARPDTGHLLQRYKSEPPVFFRELVNRVREHQVKIQYRTNQPMTGDAIAAGIQSLKIGEIDKLAEEVKGSELLRSMKFD